MGCQDLVRMAWQSTTTPFPNNFEINCTDILPGDAITHPGHYMLFRRWIDDATARKNHGKLLIYQMGGMWGKANADIIAYNSSRNRCWRRPNITDDSDGLILGDFTV